MDANRPLFDPSSVDRRPSLTAALLLLSYRQTSHHTIRDAHYLLTFADQFIPPLDTSSISGLPTAENRACPRIECLRDGEGGGVLI